MAERKRAAVEDVELSEDQLSKGESISDEAEDEFDADDLDDDCDDDDDDDE